MTTATEEQQAEALAQIEAMLQNGMDDLLAQICARIVIDPKYHAAKLAVNMMLDTALRQEAGDMLDDNGDCGSFSINARNKKVDWIKREELYGFISRVFPILKSYQGTCVFYGCKVFLSDDTLSSLIYTLAQPEHLTPKTLHSLMDDLGIDIRGVVMAMAQQRFGQGE